MKSVLMLKHIKVENANAISGLTYGFPAISNFLGFTHALSRTLQRKHNLALGGCAVICHQHHVNAYQPAGWGDYVFSLTRNPLTKEAKTAAFVEEGRMHMDVSLLVECDFSDEDFDFNTGSDTQDVKCFQDFIREAALMQRLAGGTVQSIKDVVFAHVPDRSDELNRFTRNHLFKLLPGFALVDRSELLKNHFDVLKVDKPEIEMIDAWLDFCALRQKARPEIKEGEMPNEDTSASWEYVPKPAKGWLVPIAIGFKAISPLYDGGEVARARDPNTPFRFVESAYGIGEWLGLHRIRDLDQLFWRYEVVGDFYLWRNQYAPQPQVNNNQSDQ